MGQRARPATGELREHIRQDGVTTYSLRVRAYGRRYVIKLGTELDGCNELRAQAELQSIYAQIRVGIWEPPRARADEPEPTFHEYASLWLRRRTAEGISRNTRNDYLWQLSSHLLPYFGNYRLGEITADAAEDFKEHKLDRRAQLLAAAGEGEHLLHANGQRQRPLSNTSINKFLRLLTAILESASRRGLIDGNPAARVERLRVKRRKGAILEADELESLIESAGQGGGRATTPERVRRVRELRDEHALPWRKIAQELAIASSTAVYLYRQPPATIDRSRRALVATLGCAASAPPRLPSSRSATLTWRIARSTSATPRQRPAFAMWT